VVVLVEIMLLMVLVVVVEVVEDHLLAVQMDRVVLQVEIVFLLVDLLMVMWVEQV
jgi:hypothetical protein